MSQDPPKSQPPLSPRTEGQSETTVEKGTQTSQKTSESSQF